MGREKTDDIILPQEAGQAGPLDHLDPVERANRRNRLFMEIMQDIYGPEVAKRITRADLIARHRDVAEKLFIAKPRAPRRQDGFFEAPKAKNKTTTAIN
jgi:hypothetical protein